MLKYAKLLYSERDTWPRYLVMEAKGERTLASYSPFLLQKGLKGKAGELKNVKKLRSGALLIECAKKAQAINLMTATKLADIPITCSAHKTLNFSKGRHDTCVVQKSYPLTTRARNFETVCVVFPFCRRQTSPLNHY